MLQISNLTVLNNDQIFEAVQELREMDFGVIIGTLGVIDWRVEIVYFPNPRVPLEKYEGPLNEIIMKALVLGRTVKEMDQKFFSAASPSQSP